MQPPRVTVMETALAMVTALLRQHRARRSWHRARRSWRLGRRLPVPRPACQAAP